MENNKGIPRDRHPGIPLKIIRTPETEYHQRKRTFDADLTNFSQSSVYIPVSDFSTQQIPHQKSQNSRSLS